MQLKKAINKAKCDYNRNKVINNKANPHKLWKTIKEAAPSNFKSPTEDKYVDCDADVFNKHFVSIGTCLNEEMDGQPVVDVETRSTELNCTLELVDVSESVVHSIIKKFPVNKAPGQDGITGKALACAVPALLGPITRLINKILETERIPSEFKLAIVTPIHKTGDRGKPNNYRPISVLPILSKLLERVVADQLKVHLEGNSLLSGAQHGFRSFHSTTTCLLQLTENIRKSLDDKMATGLVALDLSKAFDSIDHELLLGKLGWFGIREGTRAREFFKDYLMNRHQKVKLNGKLSNEFGDKSGSTAGVNSWPLAVCHVY